MHKQYFLFLLILLAYSSDPLPKKGEFIDKRDRQVYKTITIGTQTWMAQNLNFKTEDSWVYGDKKENGVKYGRLYTWKSAKKACPPGWHLPTLKEWQVLLKHLGMTDKEIKDAESRPAGKLAKKLKKGGGSGMEILLAGHRGKSGKYGYLEASSDLWTSTEAGKDKAIRFWITDEFEGIGTLWTFKELACSIRCIKDPPKKTGTKE